MAQSFLMAGAKKSYTRSEDGSKIYFGEYPQSEVTDRALKDLLCMKAGAFPTKEENGKWTDYGYYIGGIRLTFMWYIDVEHQGSRYRGVYFTDFRPEYATSDYYEEGSCAQSKDGFQRNTAYWYKFEPIEWRILEEKNGTAFLLANNILDSQHFYHSDSETRTVKRKTIYPNNYKESDVRVWLNEIFYATAFDEAARQIIEISKVDNSASSTEYSKNEFVCEDTQDKVFLLSYKEVNDPAYEFGKYWDGEHLDSGRQLKCTDYAKAQGVWHDACGNGFWWLRSPSAALGQAASKVGIDGSCGIGIDYDVDWTAIGIAPALRIRL